MNLKLGQLLKRKLRLPLPLNRLRQFLSRAEAEMLKTRKTRVEERKEEKRSEKRDRILRAAEAIFLDKGFHAASMNEIAEAANVSTPHLYNFYASSSIYKYVIN